MTKLDVIASPVEVPSVLLTALAQLLQELHYEKSVTNEIACLRVLSHPGIARLISAFRWRDGAYLVLEYAARGDLHTHVKQHGSLSEVSARLEWNFKRRQGEISKWVI